jgi:hypothetical protein
VAAAAVRSICCPSGTRRLRTGSSALSCCALPVLSSRRRRLRSGPVLRSAACCLPLRDFRHADRSCLPSRSSRSRTKTRSTPWSSSWAASVPKRSAQRHLARAAPRTRSGLGAGEIHSARALRCASHIANACSRGSRIVRRAARPQNINAPPHRHASSCVSVSLPPHSPYYTSACCLARASQHPSIPSLCITSPQSRKIAPCVRVCSRGEPRVFRTHHQRVTLAARARV